MSPVRRRLRALVLAGVLVASGGQHAKPALALAVAGAVHPPAAPVTLQRNA